MTIYRVILKMKPREYMVESRTQAEATREAKRLLDEKLKREHIQGMEFFISEVNKI